MDSNDDIAQPADQAADPAAVSPSAENPSPPNPKQELKEAIKEASEVLVSATTVFPLSLFPDTLTVDRTKITTTRRTFFRVAEVVSIRIEDVLHVTAHVGPLFGSIKITSRIFSDEQPYTIDHFWRDDAMRIKRIAQGYLVALKNKIDCSTLSTEELAAMLDKLGQDDHQGV